VDVAGGHAGDAEPPRQLRQRAVERAVVTSEGPLELDAERVAPEGAPQPAQRCLVAHAAPRAAAQAHQPSGVLLDILERDRGIAGDASRRGVTRVRVRTREEATEVAPPFRVADEQRDVAAIVEVDLRAVDRAKP